MPRLIARGAPLLLAVGLALGAGEPAARADPATLSRLKQAGAATRFKAGEAAIKKRDYLAAAAAFEQADSLSPDPLALWNAIEARNRAGQLARAANLCLRLLAGDETSDPYREGATAVVTELARKVGLLEISAKGGAGLTVDGQAAVPGALYVEPGEHVVSATFAGQEATQTLSVAAGASVPVALAGPAPAPSTGLPGSDPAAGDPSTAKAEDPFSGDPAGPAPGAGDAPAPKPKPLSPRWFVVGSAGTLGLLVATVASGVDTNSARAAFGVAPSRAGFDDGIARQVRTNALLGTTIGLGLVTAGAGVFLVDWHRGAKAAPPVDVALRVGPAQVAAAVGF